VYISCDVDCFCVSVYISALSVIVFCVSVYNVSAVTVIGSVPPSVRSAVLRAFRFESSDLVRAEACRAVTLLDLEGSDVITMLQERYLVEDSDTVKR